MYGKTDDAHDQAGATFHDTHASAADTSINLGMVFPDPSAESGLVSVLGDEVSYTPAEDESGQVCHADAGADNAGGGQDAQSGQVRISVLPIDDVRPSPENDKIYNPVNPADPEFLGLVESVAKGGVLDEIVVTLDGWILSGHRRHAAARRAGLAEVPCKIKDYRKADDPDRFFRELREYNRQRIKTDPERLREAVIDANPEASYRSLIEHRKSLAYPELKPIEIVGKKHRAEIKYKRQMLAAIIKVVKGLEQYWPLSDRQIHYQLLNDPPLRHDSKPDSTYANNAKCYKDLTDMLTRARLIRAIPFHAIADETRPVSEWQVWGDTGSFIKRELDSFLNGYWRNLMMSQTDHVEIVGEKNTVLGIIKPVAVQYTIPMTIGRGYCSLPPRVKMANRFFRSGKRKLVILALSDFDPDGEEIAHSFARSMRDDFDIEDIHAAKVALTKEHIEKYDLPPIMEAKETSSNHDKFVEKHGKVVHELEALPPEALQEVLREAIDSVIDVDAFNAEIDHEKRDSTFIAGVQKMVLTYMKGVDLSGPAA